MQSIPLPRCGAPTKDARRWALGALAGALAILAVGPLASAHAAGTASLTGTVTAVKGGAVEGIEVTASGSGGFGTDTTGAGGKYEINSLEGGVYSVSFSDPSDKHVFQEKNATLTEGLATELNAQLQATGSISGTVTSATTGAGLGGVSVSAVSSGVTFEFTTTEANGHYTFEGLPPGFYTLSFSPSGEYLSQSTFATVTEGGALKVDVALKQGGKISGKVTDAYSHVGLSKIGVFAFSSGVGGGFASTNENGEYTVTGLPTGSYKIEYSWNFSEAEEKAFEHAPRFIPRYITQYFNGQPSAATANTVAATEGTVTSGINVGMVPSAPVNTAPPLISGTSAVGSTLSCSSGSWTGESLSLTVGWPLTTPFGYQWLRNGAAIAGSTAQTYVVQPVDVGHGLECEVSATIEAGHASAKSSPFAVANPVPVISTSASKLRVSKGATTVSLNCANAACKGGAQLVQTVLVKQRKGKKTVTKRTKLVIAAGSYSLAAGKAGPVKLRLTKGGKSKLAGAHRLSPKLLVSVTGGKKLEKTVQLTVAAKKK